jgi:AcrR family transcriptional regulator
VENHNIRQEILTVARRLLITEGYIGLSMRLIAETVGVSKPALYYHFKDKEQLFLAVLKQYLVEVEAMIERVQAEAPSSRECILLLVRAILSQPAEQRAMIRLSSQELPHLSLSAQQEFTCAYRACFIGKIEKMIKQGIDSGELRLINPGIATWGLLGILYPYFYPAHFMDVPPADEVVDQVAGIYLDGLVRRD